jgi:hypothetical protein
MNYTVMLNYTQPSMNLNLNYYISGMLKLGHHITCGETDRLLGRSKINNRACRPRLHRWKQTLRLARDGCYSHTISHSCVYCADEIFKQELSVAPLLRLLQGTLLR